MLESMKRDVLLIMFAAAALLCAPGVNAAEKAKVDLSKVPAAAKKSPVTFAADIKPIFGRSCADCHGAKKAKGDLRLDTLASVLKGSEHGKVVIPGKALDSPLLLAVAHVGNEDYFMPPPGNRAGIPRLKEEDVGLIRAWIEQGAK
jgi:mono/diheme cytochrome c family protein